MAQHNILGREGECEAIDYLVIQGFEIVECNYNELGIEIDIIARRDDVLHIIEVKTRSGNWDSAVRAFEGERKERLIGAAERYLGLRGLDCEMSLDLIVVLVWDYGEPEIEHYIGMQFN